MKMSFKKYLHNSKGIYFYIICNGKGKLKNILTPMTKEYINLNISHKFKTQICN